MRDGSQTAACDQELPDDGTSPSQHPSEERKKKEEEQRFIQEPAASEASSTVPRVSVWERVRLGGCLFTRAPGRPLGSVGPAAGCAGVVWLR